MGIQAKLKLGVGNDDALGCGDVTRGFVQSHTDGLDALGQVVANHLDHLLVGDVFVVVAHRRFGCWREDGLR